MINFPIGLDIWNNENYSEVMSTHDTLPKSKFIEQRNSTYAQELRKIGYIQFKQLAKKNIRLPFEQFHL